MSKAIKKALTAYLQDKLDRQEPLPMTWNCTYCYDNHSGNLFKKVKTLQGDHPAGEHIADIALFDETGQLYVSIHLLKNKKVQEQLKAYYENQNVIYIQVQPGEDIAQSITQPLFVGTCFNPRCEKCNHFQQKNELFIIDAPCWKCDQPMKVAIVRAGLSRGATTRGPSVFTPEEIKFAEDKGVIIQTHFSKTVQESYLANTCPSCQTFVGEFYLFTEYYSPAETGYYPYRVYELGYHCDHCVELEWNRDE